MCVGTSAGFLHYTLSSQVTLAKTLIKYMILKVYLTKYPRAHINSGNELIHSVHVLGEMLSVTSTEHDMEFSGDRQIILLSQDHL